MLCSVWSIMMLKAMWPVDFLFDRETRIAMNAPGWRIDAVQRPGFDFYDSFFEVVRPDGRTATSLIDWDDHKWWVPHVEDANGQVLLRTLFDDRVAYVDPSRNMLYSYYTRRKIFLDELDFR